VTSVFVSLRSSGGGRPDETDRRSQGSNRDGPTRLGGAASLPAEQGRRAGGQVAAAPGGAVEGMGAPGGPVG